MRVNCVSPFIIIILAGRINKKDGYSYIELLLIIFEIFHTTSLYYDAYVYLTQITNNKTFFNNLGGWCILYLTNLFFYFFARGN